MFNDDRVVRAVRKGIHTVGLGSDSNGAILRLGLGGIELVDILCALESVDFDGLNILDEDSQYFYCLLGSQDSIYIRTLILKYVWSRV